MKAFIAMILIAGALRGLAAPDTLTTTDGATYQGITKLRADPDGLYIEYTLPGNGLGSAKVKFSRLSRGVKKEYGYDRNAALEYEDNARQATLAYQAWAAQRDAVRQEAQADTVAFQVQAATLSTARYAMASAPAGQPLVVCSPSGYFGGYGYPSGTPAPGKVRPGSTVRGFMPPDRLVTPSGLQVNRFQTLPNAATEHPSLTARSRPAVITVERR